MKRSTASILAVLAAVLLFVGVSAPSVRADVTAPVAQSATEAVFYLSGYLDGLATVQREMETFPRYSFRLMANIQLSLAFSFAKYPVFFSYLRGRADAFHQAADLMGEPR